MGVLLAVVGSDRSGSTLLDTILGSVPGVFSAGEVRYLWDRGLTQRRLCGCGVRVPDCPVWSAVIAQLPAETRDASTIVKGLDLLRTRHVLTPLVPVLGRRHRGQVRSLAAAVAPLYDAAFAITGADVLVDSSKRPTWARLLAAMPDHDLRVLHLVRDPRAVAHSRKRFKLQPDAAVRRSMTRAAPGTSAMFWTTWNLAAEHLRRDVPGMRLRYEDLMADPVAAIADVMSFCDLESHHPMLRDGAVELSPSHTVSGNPSRFKVGTVQLRLDDSWRRDQPVGDRFVVDLLTAPLARYYGYRGGRMASSSTLGTGQQQTM